MEAPPATFAAKLAATWTTLPLAIDGLFNLDITRSPALFTKIFNELGAGGVSVLPAIECDAPAVYVAAVQRLIGRYTPGLLVTTRPRHLSAVNTWVAAQGWRPNDVDLMINLGEISAYGSLVEPVIVTALNTHVPNPPPWRSVTLACSAAPKDLSALPPGRSDLPRLDWQLWRNVSRKISFNLDYGDYGISHPDLTEPPGVAMARATVSVRYTVDDHWIVLKGSPISGARGQPMDRQYRSHARALIADPMFDSLSNCWGDDHIRQIAAGTVGPGNRTTWVSICANRHLALVANRLP